MPYPLGPGHCPCRPSGPSRSRNMEIPTNAMLLEQSNCLKLGPMIRCYSSSLMETSHPSYIFGVLPRTGTPGLPKRKNLEFLPLFFFIPHGEAPKKKINLPQKIKNRGKNPESSAGANYGWTPNAKCLLPPTVALPNTTYFMSLAGAKFSHGRCSRLFSGREIKPPPGYFLQGSTA